MKTLLLCVVAAALLGGCAVGPYYDYDYGTTYYRYDYPGPHYYRYGYGYYYDPYYNRYYYRRG